MTLQGFAALSTEHYSLYIKLIISYFSDVELFVDLVYTFHVLKIPCRILPGRLVLHLQEHLHLVEVIEAKVVLSVAARLGRTVLLGRVHIHAHGIHMYV